MQHATGKRLLVALASALLLAASVGSASGARLSQSEQGFKVMYSPLSFVPSFGSPIRCPVTLEGSLHSRTITKTSGTLVGFITRVTVGTCESGRMRMDTETLPWHVTYVAFAGTLPNITRVTEDLVRLGYEFSGEIFGISMNCRYTTSEQHDTSVRESRGVITSQSPGTESTGSEIEGCPEMRLSGTGSVKTLTGGTISVALI